MNSSTDPIASGYRNADRLDGSRLDRLRFRHFKLVEALARTGNLHRAAEEMNITQPAASKILRDLEALLCTTLFERRPRSMVATAVGLFVAEHARRMLMETRRFLGAVDHLRDGGYGSLAVGAIMAAAPDILSATVSEMKRRRPLMTIQILAVTSDQLMAALERGELDLAIGRFTEPRHRALYHLEPLSGETLWAFAAADHALARRQTLSLRELGGLPWVLQPRTSPMRGLIDAAFATAGLPRLDNLVETTSIYATLQLVRQAHMLAVLPSTIVRDGIARGELVKLPVDLDNPLDNYGIITRRNEPLPAHVVEFIQALRDVSGA